MGTTMFDAMAKAEGKKIAELAEELNTTTEQICEWLTAEIVGARKYKSTWGNTVLELIPKARREGYSSSPWQIAKYIASQLHIPEATVNLRVKKYVGDGRILQLPAIKEEPISTESEKVVGLEGMIRFYPDTQIPKELAMPTEDGNGAGDGGIEKHVKVEIESPQVDDSGSIKKRVVITLTLDINVEVT